MWTPPFPNVMANMIPDAKYKDVHIKVHLCVKCWNEVIEFVNKTSKPRS